MFRTYLITLITLERYADPNPVLLQGVITTDINLDLEFLPLHTDKDIHDFNWRFWEKHERDFDSPYMKENSMCRILQWQELNYEKAREQITKAN